MQRSDLAGLPGAERVRRGLDDLYAGRRSTDALLVAVARARLRALGLAVPEVSGRDPDLALYESLFDHPSGDPYYRYNALRRELDSFISCLEKRRKHADAEPDPTGLGSAPNVPNHP